MRSLLDAYERLEKEGEAGAERQAREGGKKEGGKEAGK